MTIKDQDLSKKCFIVQKTPFASRKANLQNTILLTQPITTEQLDMQISTFTLQCNCCKRKEHGTIAKNSFIAAANHMGWRQVKTSHIDIDSACPSCVRELKEFYQTQQVPA